MIKIEIKHDLDKLTKDLTRMARQQVPFAIKNAINATAKKVVASEHREMQRAFDRPTPNTLNSVKVTKWAKKYTPEAVVSVKDFAGKGVPASKFLKAQITGGQRTPKRFEKALQAAGVMPQGRVAVFAKRSNALDAYGNLSGAKIVQILSWFKAFPESGYRANSTDRTRQAMMNGKRKGMKHGMVYFRGGRNTGLPDGIWERHYPNGTAGKSFIRPILIFVSAATYRVRLNFNKVAQVTVAREFPTQFSKALSDAMKSAK